MDGIAVDQQNEKLWSIFSQRRPRKMNVLENVAIDEKRNTASLDLFLISRSFLQRLRVM
jgi:hypothetical protein